MSSPALYLWIPRTAGTSLWAACEENNKGCQRIGVVKGRKFKAEARATTFQHCYAPAFIDDGTTTRGWVDRQFKFAIVRNPWARLVSVYYHLSQGRKNQREALHGMDWEAFAGGVCQCVRIEPPARKTSYMSYAAPQTSWLRWPDGSWIPDYVGRFDGLQRAWGYIRHQTGLKGKLPKFNRSQHDDYRDYYTPDLRARVAIAYEEEIDLWGFTFGDEAKA